MRRWKFMAAALTAVAAGTVALTVPTAGAAPVCGGEFRIDENVVVSEGAGQITFQVALSPVPAPTGCTRWVKYRTRTFDGTSAAIEGENHDYLFEDETLTWQPSDQSGKRPITIELWKDGFPESTESFGVELYSSSSNAKIIGALGTGTIADDDTVTFTNVGVTLNPSGTPDCTSCRAGNCMLTIELSEPLTLPETVAYSTIDDTAKDGQDFAGVRDGRMTIPAGATRGTFTIQVFRNTPGEPTESFEVVLTSVSSGTILHGRVEVHILSGS